MAKVKGGLLGSVSGKLGPVVVVQRGDTTYVRARPVYTENSWSERQLKNQQRFRAVNAFCTQNKLMVIQPIWNKLVAGKSGYHLFLKANMPAFGRDGGLEDLSLLHFSDGKLALPFHLQARRLDAMTIRVSWENDPLLPASRMRDELLFITAEDQQFNGIMSAGINRSLGEGTIRLPEGSAAARGIYLFFATPDRSTFSPDRYMTL